MRNAWIVVAGIAIVGFAVAVLATRERSQPLTFTKSSSGNALAGGEPEKQPSEAPAKYAHDDAVVQDAAPQRDFHEELKNAEDLLEFAASVLAEATVVGTRELRQQVLSACRHADSLSREIALGRCSVTRKSGRKAGVRSDSRPSTEANIMRKITGSMLRSRRVTTFAVVAK